MILYLSNATAYPIYNKLFQAGKIKSGYQMQKFNNNLICGISHYCSVVAISPLPYINVKANRIDEVYDNVRYIALKNQAGKLHKVMNIMNLLIESSQVINNNKIDYILCDAIAKSPQIASLYLSKRYHIPAVGIVTDLPGMLRTENSTPMKHIYGMQKFDGYIFLTEQMNTIVNPQHKPYMIMEGLCAENLPVLRKKNETHIVLYTGSIWKIDAGIECLVEGFLKAKLENCELHFYGTGELVPWLIEIERDHPQVKYKGCVTNDEIAQVQGEATLLVNPRPSHEDFCKYSFPSKTIEYMASGTPVLMTRLPGVPDEYFKYVYIIEQENADGIRDALIRTLSNAEELKSKGLQARNFVAKKKGCCIQTSKVWNFMNQQCGRGK